MDGPKSRPRKSLRTLLIVWFLVFSVVPLAFLTGYSLMKYEEAIDQELQQRLEGNQREVKVILEEYEEVLKDKIRSHASDQSMVYYLSQGRIGSARNLVKKWLNARFAPHRLNLINRNGRLQVAYAVGANGEVNRQKQLESQQIYLSDEFLDSVKNDSLKTLIELKGSSRIDLIAFSRMQTKSGYTIGYIEEIIEMDKGFLESLKKRLNIELVFFSLTQDQVVSSHEDLETYNSSFFQKKFRSDQEQLIEMTIRGEPFGFMAQPIEWGDQKFYMAIGASKKAAQRVLENVNVAFYSVVGLIIILLIILSLIISKILLRPLSQLVFAIQKADPEKGSDIELSTQNDTELGVVAENFKSMYERTRQAQSELKSKIKELEEANTQIRETQAKLIHTAKMASLGQLVAGVAHELNNPIGFIYSNMAHLRDYSQRLISLIKTAEEKPKDLKKEKEKNEFDYIVKDMPKLIKSCEDGARRTRDIVVGLRNFSRLEEAKLDEVNVEESLENTLNLLTGELKNRIKVNKEFGGVPKLPCYPSQLNQVFMNILSNAAQAIEGEGEIFLKTWKDGNYAVISIRDTGKGMPPETIDKIFDPFFSTKSLGSGTGLGLSITYGIIQQHGGDIQVQSDVGAGTQFLIQLPLSGPPKSSSVSSS